MYCRFVYKVTRIQIIQFIFITLIVIIMDLGGNVFLYFIKQKYLKA